jgi:hypothetical protein
VQPHSFVKIIIAFIGFAATSSTCCRGHANASQPKHPNNDCQPQQLQQVCLLASLQMSNLAHTCCSSTIHIPFEDLDVQDEIGGKHHHLLHVESCMLPDSQITCSWQMLICGRKQTNHLPGQLQTASFMFQLTMHKSMLCICASNQKLHDFVQFQELSSAVNIFFLYGCRRRLVNCSQRHLAGHTCRRQALVQPKPARRRPR